MDDLLDRIGPDADFVIWQGPATGRFHFYRRPFGPESASNGVILPGAGYIVKMSAPGELVVMGEPWPFAEIELRAGLNLIGLTRVDPELNRMSDLGTRIGLAFTQGIAYDPDAGRFVAFLRDFAPGSPVDRPVRVGEAYIIQVRYRTVLAQEGPPPVAP